MVSAHLDGGVDSPAMLTVTVRDSGSGATAAALRRGRLNGVGLKNVERRLVCLYGEAASLALRSAPGRGTTVELRLPAGVAAESAAGLSTR
jgi:sensor histidine kinase YesM